MPEIVGPMAGATEMTIEMLPMVRPRCSGGTSVITVVMSSGIMMAVPQAWITRATTSTCNPGASVAASVPRLKSDIARMKMGRVFSRCSMKPVMGMTVAMVSRNAVVSHCAELAGTSKLCMSRGIATPMIVSLRITTKAEISSRSMTSRWRGSIFGRLAGAVVAAGVSGMDWALVMRPAMVPGLSRCDAPRAVSQPPAAADIDVCAAESCGVVAFAAMASGATSAVCGDQGVRGVLRQRLGERGCLIEPRHQHRRLAFQRCRGIGRNHHTQTPAQSHECIGDGSGLRIGVPALDDAAIYLDLVDLEATQVQEARVARAEVVEHDLHAVLAQRRQRAP